MIIVMIKIGFAANPKLSLLDQEQNKIITDINDKK